MKRKDRLYLTVATCFGLGYSPYFPGTCGALLGVAIYLPIAYLIAGEPFQTLAIGGALVVWSVITVALGGWAEEFFHKKDSGIFVTDEVVGFLLTVLLWRGASDPLLIVAWAFPVTRIIDMIKVPPARRLEKLPRGWGVLADDLLGSLYAAALLYVLCLSFPSWFGGG
ncbi:MAG TPA: phosphatidylglycerophosphatase A [Pirellulaceae bacterium]|nr:phosphatidylglycerophosphatase A [Pirellulaceae bacterium]